jgi:CheY-like chemotaxis protein
MRRAGFNAILELHTGEAPDREVMALRLLIVDDNGHFLEAARNLLEREGARVVGVASTSSEALRLASELRPDVILLDVDLGEESGFDVARRFAAGNHAPVVLISAYPEAEFADLVQASSAVGFLSKSDLSLPAVSDLLRQHSDRRSGSQLQNGDHVCAFYFGTKERDNILLPYLREGLRQGQKCIGVVDALEPTEVVVNLGVGAEEAIRSRQLELLHSREAYLRTRRFDTREMIDFFDGAVGPAMRSGQYDCARVVGEMTWSLQDVPGVDDLVDYESEVNDFVPRYAQVVLCMYDLERFGGGLVSGLLRTHPKILLGGLVIENPHYLSPDEFRATRA